MLIAGAESNRAIEAGYILTETSIASARSGLTYKKLPDNIFFWTALLLQASMLTIAITAKNIEPVFDFLGAFGCNSITFLFPGLGYLVAFHRFGSNKEKSWELLFNQVIAITFLILWVLILALYVFITVKKATGEYEEYEEE